VTMQCYGDSWSAITPRALRIGVAMVSFVSAQSTNV
jgi:hypothetical protein